jgi:DNA-binding transcriptional LysR family regulator
MEIHQLKTFVAVAREGSITRASELLHLSQPAVSAQIKSLEDALGLTLFERTPRGMSLTTDGQRLLAKAERTLGAHQELIVEAARIKAQLSGKLRLGAGSNSDSGAASRLLAAFAERFPEVEVALEHGASLEILAAIQSGRLDAGFYNEAGEPAPELAALALSQFSLYLAAAPGLVSVADPVDWKALAELPWIYPAASACCGRTAESLFQKHRIRPKRIVSVDRESVTRTLIAARTGIGLLHAETAQEARARGEVELLFESPTPVRVLFAHLATRAQDPLVAAAASILREPAR